MYHNMPKIPFQYVIETKHMNETITFSRSYRVLKSRCIFHEPLLSVQKGHVSSALVTRGQRAGQPRIRIPLLTTLLEISCSH